MANKLKARRNHVHQSVKHTLAVSGQILNGEHDFESDDRFDVILFDPNKKWVNKKDHNAFHEWIQQQFGRPVGCLPRRAKYRQGKVTVTIYDSAIGFSGDWLLAKWERSARKPWFSLATEDMYTMMLEETYEQVK